MLRRRQWASVKNLRLDEPGHRPAQTVRNSESATAEIVIPVVHLNLAIIVRRDQSPATKHGAGGSMLIVELQTDTINLRRISGQLEQQTPFQCLILRLLQVAGSIDYLNSHPIGFLDPINLCIRPAYNTAGDHKSTNRKCYI
jgi:hypothetical protein